MKTKCKQCQAVIGFPHRKFCSDGCKIRWHNTNRILKPNLIYDCKVCGKHVEKWVSPSSIGPRKNTGEFCSRTCAGIGRKGKRHHNWKGGRHKDKDGYILVYFPDHPGASSGGYVREHRLKMERKLGRYLTAEEVVHHKDDNPSNNRISNLVLCTNNAKHKQSDYKERQIDSRGRFIPKGGKKC